MMDACSADCLVCSTAALKVGSKGARMAGVWVCSRADWKAVQMAAYWGNKSAAQMDEPLADLTACSMADKLGHLKGD